MSETIQVPLLNDDYVALVRLARETSVPIDQLAGCLLSYLLDDRDADFLASQVRRLLALYSAGLQEGRIRPGSHPRFVEFQKEVNTHDPTPQSVP